METLSGSVERVTFYNPEMVRVIRLPRAGLRGPDWADARNDVGNSARIKPGEHVKLQEAGSAIQTGSIQLKFASRPCLHRGASAVTGSG